MIAIQQILSELINKTPSSVNTQALSDGVNSQILESPTGVNDVGKAFLTQIQKNTPYLTGAIKKNLGSAQQILSIQKELDTFSRNIILVSKVSGSISKGVNDLMHTQ
jgi:hypothetical protein